jgi:hypothetical protein
VADKQLHSQESESKPDGNNNRRGEGSQGSHCRGWLRASGGQAEPRSAGTIIYSMYLPSQKWFVVTLAIAPVPLDRPVCLEIQCPHDNLHRGSLTGWPILWLAACPRGTRRAEISILSCLFSVFALTKCTRCACF